VIAVLPRLLAALGLTLALGILSRQRPIGWYPYDKSLGDVLYAVAAYLGFALVLRLQPPWVVAVLALLFCGAVETFKLTGIPARYGPHSILLRWTLGTEFAWHNIACYVLGVGIIAGIGGAFLRPGRVRA
jgi:uncharacterized protein DUF2809